MKPRMRVWLGTSYSATPMQSRLEDQGWGPQPFVTLLYRAPNCLYGSWQGPLLKGWDQAQDDSESAALAAQPFTEALRAEMEEYYFSHYASHFGTQVSERKGSWWCCGFKGLGWACWTPGLLPGQAADRWAGGLLARVH